MADPQQEALVERLARYPVERYPVQHATAQFHLGVAALGSGDVALALDALCIARPLFGGLGMVMEEAKSTLMCGIALRALGCLEEAVSCFSLADDAFAALGQRPEQAAAAHNLGLVLHERGEVQPARAAWERARALFLDLGRLSEAAASAREHGASLLTAGEIDAALALLREAASLAERAGDDPGTAAAGNVLGLAHLAAGDAPAAVTVLRRSLAFVPRSVRPAEHAMVKANLALAHERCGEAARARLAARQAAAVRGAAAPVRRQAEEVMSRLAGDASADLLSVLDEEARSGWVPVVREELIRAAEAPPGERSECVRGFVDGVLGRPEVAHALAESFLAVVLELPPRPYAHLVEALVGAVAHLPAADSERARAIFASAMARFAIPQWQRLAASLNAAESAAGRSPTWR